MNSRRFIAIGLGAAGLLGFLAIWAAASAHLRNAILLPGPRVVAWGFVDLARDPAFWKDVGSSLQRVLVGFIGASILAVPLALALAFFHIARGALIPVITLLRPIPPIAWIPMAILWFGLGDKPSYFITGIAAFFPIFLNVYSGGLAVESEHVHAARCLGAKRWALIRCIYLPSTLPLIWTGLRIGLGQAWMAVVTAELIAAHSGLGFFIQISRTNLETPNVLVGMLVIGVIGSLMTAALNYGERWVIPWRRLESKSHS
ncbi:MAG TPA: ABC transporter permease [Opitutaceae bacterium]